MERQKLEIPNGCFNDFQMPPNYLIISSMEFALETNLSAIPTCISSFFSVCLCMHIAFSELTWGRDPHDDFLDTMSNANTAILLCQEPCTGRDTAGHEKRGHVFADRVQQ